MSTINQSTNQPMNETNHETMKPPNHQSSRTQIESMFAKTSGAFRKNHRFNNLRRSPKWRALSPGHKKSPSESPRTEARGPYVGPLLRNLESNSPDCRNSSRFSHRHNSFARNDCRASCAVGSLPAFAKLPWRQIDFAPVRGKSVTTELYLPRLRQEDVIVKMRALFSLAGALGLCVAGLSNAQEAKRMPAADMTVASSAVNNQDLANAVVAQLQKCSLRGFTIDIFCQDGIVAVRGQVADKAQHDLVVRSIYAVPGVKNVIDGLAMAEVRPVQGFAQAEPGVLPPPAGGRPIVDPIPVGQPGVMMNDLNPPKMPPYSWPSYAPYNNYSRVAYPQAYPYNAWPFIGPFYPFPKVPLGWRSVTLEWQDGHWWMGRNATTHDYWRVRYQ
jgi:hypothetical protein